MSLPEIVTIDDVAAKLGVPRATVLRKAQELGYLIEIGSARVMLADEVREFLQECRSAKRVPDSTLKREKTDEPQSTSSAKRGVQTLAQELKTSPKRKGNSPSTSASVTPLPSKEPKT